MITRKMITKGTRSAAILLSTTLLASSMAACSDGKSQQSSSGSSSASSSEAAEDKIKWSGTISVAPYMMGPIEDDQITPLVEARLKEYGYDVKLENVYIENNQYAELMNLRIASGDAPDIFKLQDDATFLQYTQQGVIASWSEDFFREHAPHVAEYIDSGAPANSNADIVDEAWEMVKYEDKMAAIPLIARNNGSPINVIYNKQWLTKLGASVPETLDDFISLMYRFKNEDPDGNGKNDTYGLSTTMLNVIFGAYGSFPGFLHMDYGHWYDVDGKLVSADVMENNKETLTLIKKLFDDGVLDPEFVTGENQGGYWAISHPFVNGRIGVTHSASMNHYTPVLKEGTSPGVVLQEFQAIQGKDAEVTIGPWLEGSDGDIGGFLRYAIQLGGGTVYNASLNQDQDKLAAIFEILDIFNQDDELSILAGSGIEGQHYVKQAEGDLQGVEGLDGARQNAAGIRVLRGLYGPETPLNETAFTINDTSISNKWNAETKSQYKGLSNDIGYLSKLYTALPSQGQYSGEIKTYRDETWLGFIQGTIALDKYDSYVEEWNKRGGQILTDEANEWYEARK